MRKIKRRNRRNKNSGRNLRLESLERRIALAVTPGDFSLDNGVNGIDLDIWEGVYGTSSSVGDANGDGVSSGLDFLIWQRNVGMPSGVCPEDPAPDNVTVVLDTDFTSAEGYVGDGVGGDDPLPFQSPPGAGNGGWLGQTNAQIDAGGTGIVTSIGGPFDRNTYSAGANGGFSGGGGTLTTSEFTPGDQLRITADYQFNLSANATVELAAFGFRDGFGTTEGQAYGFNAIPQQGWDSGYNTFGSNGGTVKFFPDKADTANADAIIIDGNDLGIDPNDDLGNGVDLVSDQLQVTYVASYQGAGNWSVDSLTIENLDTSTTFEYSGPTQTFTYYESYTGALAMTPASDAFYAQQLAINSDAGFSGVVDAAKFELIEVIPEVTTIVDTHFTLADGYVDGALASPDFQQGWLGQTGFVVDADGTGTVTVDATTDPFKRVVNGAGAKGGTGGVPSTDDFNADEQLRITIDYQFTLGADLNTNTLLAGIRDEGPNAGNGFESSPQQGFYSNYNTFGTNGGSVKFYPDLNDTDNADALIVDGSLLGIDPGDDLGNGVDLVSDNLQITYLVSTDGADNWTVDSFTVENLDTSTTYEYAGPTQTFTFSGTDAFVAMQLANSSQAGLIGVTDQLKFELLTPPPVELSSYSTDFTAAEGYVAGEIAGGPWQQGWLGQTGSLVDETGSGTVSSGDGIGTAGFLRVLQSAGATGGSAGGGGTLSTSSFQDADTISIDFDYQFMLGSNANADLFKAGIRDGFGITGGRDYGFDATPQQGFGSQFNVFGTQGGSVKFFPDFADFGNNPDALILDGELVGIDPGDTLGNGVDLVSDQLRFHYEASSDGLGGFTVDSFSVENLDTGITYDYAGPTQTFTYYQSFVGAVASTPAEDAFFAMQLAATAQTGYIGTSNAVTFELLDPLPVGPGPLAAASTPADPAFAALGEDSASEPSSESAASEDIVWWINDGDDQDEDALDEALAVLGMS